MNERDEFLRDRLQPGQPQRTPPAPAAGRQLSRAQSPRAAHPGFHRPRKGPLRRARRPPAPAPAAPYPHPHRRRRRPTLATARASRSTCPPRPPGRHSRQLRLRHPPRSLRLVPGPMPPSRPRYLPRRRNCPTAVGGASWAGHLWPRQAGSVGRATRRRPIRSGHPDRPARQPQGRRARQRRRRKDVGGRQRRIDPRRTAPAGPRRGHRRRHRLRPIEQPNRSARQRLVLGTDRRQEPAVLRRRDRACRPEFRRAARTRRRTGGRPSQGARSGDLPGGRAAAGSPFRDLGHRLRLDDGLPRSPRRCCAIWMH